MDIARYNTTSNISNVSAIFYASNYICIIFNDLNPNNLIHPTLAINLRLHVSANIYPILLLLHKMKMKMEHYYKVKLLFKD